MRGRGDKRDSEDYENFARRAAASPIAETSSWLAADNCDLSRIELKLITNASKNSACELIANRLRTLMLVRSLMQ